MATIEEAIAWQNRRGIALVEAFGLDAARVPENDGIELRNDGGVKFNTIDGQREFPGKKLTKKQAAALHAYRYPTSEPKREPTWRDVFRAMHAAGYKLKFEECEGDYRKWVVPVGTMGEVASIIRETLGGKASWTVEIYGYLMYSVRLHNPPPSDVLAAAKLVKLIDTPTCGQVRS
jgi:hypothetical protein